jgi:hypothetical protein
MMAVPVAAGDQLEAAAPITVVINWLASVQK